MELNGGGVWLDGGQGRAGLGGRCGWMLLMGEDSSTHGPDVGGAPGAKRCQGQGESLELIHICWRGGGGRFAQANSSAQMLGWRLIALRMWR